jgi:8-oxo-dGTP diphosphatase
MPDVVAAVIQHKGRILIAERGSGRLAGKWEFPGGKIEAGETPREALVREIREEFAVTIHVGPLIECVAIPGSPVNARLLAYLAAPLCGRFLPRVHTRIAWVVPRELLQADLAPADMAVAAKVAALAGSSRQA